MTMTLACLLAPAWAVTHGAAAGNGSSGSGRAEGILVAEVVLLLVVGRLLGEVMQRLRQPALMGQLLAGIVLGPSLFGWVWPQAQQFLFPHDAAQKGMIDGLSQIGILMLLLLTGMETDLRLVRKSGFAAVAIALSGIALPFACGFATGEFLPAAMLGDAGGGRLVTSLFLGTALSISSIKIVAMVVREMKFMRRNLGQIIVATAIMEDTVGWVIIAITFGIAGNRRTWRPGRGRGPCRPWQDRRGRRPVPGFLPHHRPLAGVQRDPLGQRQFPQRVSCHHHDPGHHGGRRAHHPVAGGAHRAGRFHGGSADRGIAHPHRPYPAAVARHDHGLLMPVFFGMSGLAADLTILKDPRLALLTVGLVLIASVGKFSGAFLGSVIGRLKWREGIALGCAMNARGSTEVIVASIGLSMGALTQNLYTMIVTMAVITTMAMPPMLRAALSGIPMSADEKKRVEREALDERGFVPNLERLLLAVDASPLGRLAARLAGSLAGAQGMPVTILKLDPDLRAANSSGESVEKSSPREPEQANSTVATAAEQAADPVAREVTSGARTSAAQMTRDAAEPDPEKVHLTTRTPADKPAAVVKDEARKGYDLLFIGLESGHTPDGNFTPELTEIAAGFDGPLAILSRGGEDTATRLTRSSRLLVPVNGTPASRNAAEIAFALARPSGARVTALFVSRNEGRARTLSGEEGVLRDMTLLAQRYDVRLSTRISRRTAAAEAILREAGDDYAMIVMGVAPRTGEQLFFGDTAAEILKQWKKLVLLVAS